MSKYSFMLPVLLGLLWAAARGQQTPPVPLPPVQVGPLRLEKVSVAKTSGHCKDGPCVTARIDTLKVVSAPNAQVGAKLNAAIAGWVSQVDGGQEGPKNLDDVIEQFVDAYWEVHRGDAGSDRMYRFPWYLSRVVKIEYQSARVLSLSCENVSYGGGAHPNGTLTYANLRSATAERIRLTDILREGCAGPLNNVGERRFRELKGLSPKDDLKEADFRFPNDHFQLNENFSIGADGLTFYLNNYEIAPYADGPTKLFLPYADFQMFLRVDADVP